MLRSTPNTIFAVPVGTSAVRGGELRRGRLAAALLATVLVLLGACGTPPPPPSPLAATEPEHWSYNRIVDTPDGMITLFDPADLAHHAADPDGWYRQDFAFANDLATGRFAAVLSGQPGTHRVRVTSAPPDARERASGAPSATLRLRVLNRRLLLAGGDAWPSLAQPRPVSAADERWLAVPDGDYRVSVSVRDDPVEVLRDVVFRLEEVASIDRVAHAPGIPYLVPGERPALAGIGSESLRLQERCGEVPPSARWSPLIERALPLPGQRDVRVELIEPLYARGHALRIAMLPDEGPLIVAREARVGALGVQLVPEEWLEPRFEDGIYRELFEVRGHTGCTVRITGVEGFGNDARLNVEPLPLARERLSLALAHALVGRFDRYIVQSNDPAWRYKSGWVQSAPDHVSMVLGVMRYLDLPAADVESLLLESNAARAEWLLDYMGRPPAPFSFGAAGI